MITERREESDIQRCQNQEYSTNGPPIYNEIFVFGSNRHSQIGLSENNAGKNFCTPRFCSFNVVFTSVSCGAHHSIFLTREGYVYTVGSNIYGQMGSGNCEHNYSFTPSLVQKLQDQAIVKVVSGAYHNLVLTNDKLLFSWGRNKEGQLGIGKSVSHQPEPQIVQIPDDEKVSNIFGGGNHSFLITTKREVYGFGSGKEGQLGTGKLENSNIPCRIFFKNQDHLIAKIAAGENHSLFLTEQGQVYGCGDNQLGQIGIGKRVKNASAPQIIPPDNFHNEEVEDIACSRFSIGITKKSATVYAWGQLFFLQDSPIFTPKMIITLSSDSNSQKRSNPFVRKMAVGNESCIVLTQKGELFSWGRNSFGECGLQDFKDKSDSFHSLKFLKDKKILTFHMGENHSIVLGRTLHWRDPLKSQQSQQSSLHFQSTLSQGSGLLDSSLSFICSEGVSKPLERDETSNEELVMDFSNEEQKQEEMNKEEEQQLISKQINYFSKQQTSSQISSVTFSSHPIITDKSLMYNSSKCNDSKIIKNEQTNANFSKSCSLNNSNSQQQMQNSIPQINSQLPGDSNFNSHNSSRVIYERSTPNSMQKKECNYSQEEEQETRFIALNFEGFSNNRSKYLEEAKGFLRESVDRSNDIQKKEIPNNNHNNNNNNNNRNNSNNCDASQVNYQSCQGGGGGYITFQKAQNFEAQENNKKRSSSLLEQEEKKVNHQVSNCKIKQQVIESSICSSQSTQMSLQLLSQVPSGQFTSQKSKNQIKLIENYEKEGDEENKDNEENQKQKQYDFLKLNDKLFFMNQAFQGLIQKLATENNQANELIQKAISSESTSKSNYPYTSNKGMLTNTSEGSIHSQQYFTIENINLHNNNIKSNNFNVIHNYFEEESIEINQNEDIKASLKSAPKQIDSTNQKTEIILDKNDQFCKVEIYERQYDEIFSQKENINNFGSELSSEKRRSKYGGSKQKKEQQLQAILQSQNQDILESIDKFKQNYIHSLNDPNIKSKIAKLSSILAYTFSKSPNKENIPLNQPSKLEQVSQFQNFPHLKSSDKSEQTSLNSFHQIKQQSSQNNSCSINNNNMNKFYYQVQNLSVQLSQKEKDIADLQLELANKEMQIQSLELKNNIKSLQAEQIDSHLQNALNLINKFYFFSTNFSKLFSE